MNIFAANVAKVLNILEMVKITKVPKAPEFMLGVINLRGNVLPVIDLRMKFGIEANEISKNTCILVLDIEMEKDKLQVGAVVDSVQEVLEITDENIQPPPNLGSKFRSEFIYGMSKKDEDFIMLLDMDRVFTQLEISELRSEAIDNEKKKIEELG